MYEFASSSATLLTVYTAVMHTRRMNVIPKADLGTMIGRHTSDFLLGNNLWEPSLDRRQDSSVEQIHSRGELAEQPMTCALVHCHEKVALLNDNFRLCFCLMTSSNMNVGSA